jgi:hypothetical protein
MSVEPGGDGSSMTPIIYKRILQVSCIVAVLALIWFEWFGGRVDPYDVLHHQLGVPRASIIFANKFDHSREATFIGYLSSAGTTNWPTLFSDLGCLRQVDPAEVTRIQKVMSNDFALTPAKFMFLTNGDFTVWTGPLRRSSYFLNSVVTKTNAYVVLDRY